MISRNTFKHFLSKKFKINHQKICSLDGLLKRESGAFTAVIVHSGAFCTPIRTRGKGNACFVRSGKSGATTY